MISAIWSFSSASRTGTFVVACPEHAHGIQRELDELKAPPSLLNIKVLVIQSIEDQSGYFKKWDANIKEGKSYQFNSHDPLIQSSHRKLINAYNQLMGKFPLETRVNKQAFFDHLCALDFI